MELEEWLRWADYVRRPEVGSVIKLLSRWKMAAWAAMIEMD